MNEQDIFKNIKLGVKSPSSDFTDKVMGEVSSLHNEMPTENKWKFNILFFACCLIFILSVFISIPQIQVFNFLIGFSPVIMPIISLIFIFVIFQQLYEIRYRIKYGNPNNVVK